MRRFLAMLLLCLAPTAFAGKLHEQEIEYTADDVVMKGYLVYDDEIKHKRPGILVVHEWWGHNDYTRRRARMLAELGYVALAVDMYGDGRQAEHPQDAGKFSSEVMRNAEGARARFLAAREILAQHEAVDAKNIGAIGYCFGGAVVLNMARTGVDLKGVVSFHGALVTSTPAKAGVVKARVLVCHGAADNFTSKDDIENFKKEMKAARVNYTFKEYANAKHAFTNPAADANAEKFGIGLAYNEKADKDSWEDMKKFLTDVFKN